MSFNVRFPFRNPALSMWVEIAATGRFLWYVRSIGVGGERVCLICLCGFPGYPACEGVSDNIADFERKSLADNNGDSDSKNQVAGA